MIKTHTFTRAHELSELFFGQVDNPCNKQSALVIKGERWTQLTPVSPLWIHCRRKRFMRCGGKEKQVSYSSTGRSHSPETRKAGGAVLSPIKTCGHSYEPRLRFLVAVYSLGSTYLELENHSPSVNIMPTLL